MVLASVNLLPDFSRECILPQTCFDYPVQNLSCRLHAVLLHSIGYNFGYFLKDNEDREAVPIVFDLGSGAGPAG